MVAGADVGAGAGAGAAAAGARAGRGAAGWAGDCAATDCGAGAGEAGAAAAGGCGDSDSSSDDDPHPTTIAVSRSARVSSRSFGIAPRSSRGRAVLVVLVISLSSCIRLWPTGRFWPSHMYRRTRCGFCSRGVRPSSYRRRPEPRGRGVCSASRVKVAFTLTPTLSLRERGSVGWYLCLSAYLYLHLSAVGEGVVQRSENERGGLFCPPRMRRLIVGISGDQTSAAGLNFTRVYSSETSSKTASTGMSISASSISQSMRLEGIRGPSLSWMIA